MVKRFRAWILAIMLLATSGGLAQAESPKGEAKKTNKTNIETSAPVENASNENEIVKVNEATGEEVIVAQFDNELDTMLAQFQSEECRQIVSLAYEIAKDNELGTEPQITGKDIDKIRKGVIKAFSETSSLDEKAIAGISLGSYIFNVDGLSDDEKQELSNKYYDEDAFKAMYELIDVCTHIKAYDIFDPWDNMNLNIFSVSPQHTELISKFENAIASYGGELKDGNFDLSHHQELMGCYNFCESALQGTGVGILMKMIAGKELGAVQLIYLAAGEDADKYEEYLNLRDGVFNVPDSTNPTPIEQMIIDCDDLHKRCSEGAIEAEIKALIGEIKITGK